jgi:hypothetical protein
MSSEFGVGEEFLKKKILKGNVLRIGDRIIYPMIQVSTLEFEDKFWFESITPIAIAVLEKNNKYLISLTDEESEEYQSLELDEIFD